jgi:hypothetical protein
VIFGDPPCPRWTPPTDKTVNAAHARLRAPGERANAQLKSWKTLRKMHSSLSDATDISTPSRPSSSTTEIN